ncbi:MAG: TIGR03118 family protein [Verrucomicrobiota bacterium]
MNKTRFGHQCHRSPNSPITHLSRIIFTTAWALTGALAALSPKPAMAQNAYVQSNLVSDIPGLALVTDTNLINPWGIAASATSPFWLSDNVTGLSTVYTGAGVKESLVVTIPVPSGESGPSSPTGIIANTVAGFQATGTATAHFIFSTQNGTISAWNTGSAAVLKVDLSSSYADFTGLAAGVSGGSNFIYAPDFYNGQIDVFDTNYALVTLAGSFHDPAIPAGYSPFGIQNINGELFVTYALQSGGYSYVSGPGNGYVDIFDTSGNLLQSFAAQGPLNAPWGVALAPIGFGYYAGNILIGNFGDGRINVFNPATGAWAGPLMNNTNGGAIEVAGLWGLAFGNGKSGGDAHTL